MIKKLLLIFVAAFMIGSASAQTDSIFNVVKDKYELYEKYLTSGNRRLAEQELTALVRALYYMTAMLYDDATSEGVNKSELKAELDTLFNAQFPLPSFSYRATEVNQDTVDAAVNASIQSQVGGLRDTASTAYNVANAAQDSANIFSNLLRTSEGVLDQISTLKSDVDSTQSDIIAIESQVINMQSDVVDNTQINNDNIDTLTAHRTELNNLLLRIIALENEVIDTDSPVLLSANIDDVSKALLELVFNETVTVSDTTGWDTDSIGNDDSPLYITSVNTGSGTNISFNLSRDLVYGDSVWVSYDTLRGESTVDAAGNELLDTILFVNNNVLETAIDDSVFTSRYVTYWVDQTSGNDGNDGLAPSKAWKTLINVNSLAVDSTVEILFKAGETWNETLAISDSGMLSKPILLSSYDSGDKPSIQSVSLTGQYFDVSKLEITGSTGDGLILNNVSNSDFYNLIADNNTLDGIDISNSNTVEFHHIQVTNNSGYGLNIRSGNTGIIVRHATGVKNTNNDFQNSSGVSAEFRGNIYETRSTSNWSPYAYNHDNDNEDSFTDYAGNDFTIANSNKYVVDLVETDFGYTSDIRDTNKVGSYMDAGAYELVYAVSSTGSDGLTGDYNYFAITENSSNGDYVGYVQSWVHRDTVSSISYSESSDPNNAFAISSSGLITVNNASGLSTSSQNEVMELVFTTTDGSLTDTDTAYVRVVESAYSVFIDPSSGTNGSGSKASPYNTWDGVSIQAGYGYFQKRGTSFDPSGYRLRVDGITATAAAPTILAAYGTGDKPTITNTGHNHDGIYVGGDTQGDSTSHVLVDNFEIDQTGRAGIYMRTYYSNITIQNCDVKETNYAADAVGYVGVWTWPHPLYQDVNVIIRNTRSSKAGEHGFKFQGQGVDAYNVVAYNNQARGLSMPNQSTNHNIYGAHAYGNSTSNIEFNGSDLLADGLKVTGSYYNIYIGETVSGQGEDIIIRNFKAIGGGARTVFFENYFKNVTLEDGYLENTREIMKIEDNQVQTVSTVNLRRIEFTGITGSYDAISANEVNGLNISYCLFHNNANDAIQLNGDADNVVIDNVTSLKQAYGTGIYDIDNETGSTVTLRNTLYEQKRGTFSETTNRDYVTGDVVDYNSDVFTPAPGGVLIDSGTDIGYSEDIENNPVGSSPDIGSYEFVE